MPRPGTIGYTEVWVHGLRCAAAQYAVHMEFCVATSHWVNWAVEPEPSDRTTGMILIDGRRSRGLSAAIAGSFHILIAPVKIFAMFAPDSRRFVTRWLPIFRLYMNVVPPAETGT